MTPKIYSPILHPSHTFFISYHIQKFSIRNLPAPAEKLCPEEDAHKSIRKIVELRHSRIRRRGSDQHDIMAVQEI